ncbi:hypothetical protein I7I50_06150 [Histoplasma capsulatum G186AR]|uniref:Uncharacterized protein n=1 Tax=Ajellomyces capsulatus TaxID=5037 RepID=A0A8H7YZV0_AJECA|nr:hypothetical protein I7I52_10772 [Histoplasma capsulatum]QSS67153.1 hypothetical protein I7I50_06150 [Histoplasma capsulatum G186AR]
MLVSARMLSGRRTQFASWSALVGSGQAVKHKPCENVAVFTVFKTQQVHGIHRKWLSQDVPMLLPWG